MLRGFPGAAQILDAGKRPVNLRAGLSLVDHPLICWDIPVLRIEEAQSLNAD